MPDDSKAAFEDGRTLFENRQYDEAITTLREALRQNPACSGANYYLGRSLLEKKEREKAIAEFSEAIRKDPSDAASRYWLAVLLLRKGNIDDASALLYEAMRIAPGQLHTVIGQVSGLFQDQCGFAETEEFLKNSIAILSEEPMPQKDDPDTGRSLAHLHARLGELYSRKGLLNGAMLQYREAVRIATKESAFHGALADIYFITNNDGDAVMEYRAALVHDPENAGLHKRLGDALVKTRQFIDAFNEYREAVRIEPENGYYRKVYSRFRTLFIGGSSGAVDPGAPGPQPVTGDTGSSADEAFRRLISNGENESVEFKSSALWSKTLSKAEILASESREVHKYGRDTSKVLIARTIAGFLNTEGGNLVIGIHENKSGAKNEIIGIEGEYPKLRDRCPDGYRRMLIDEIIRKFLPPGIFHHLNRYIRIHFMNLEGRTLCWITIRKADESVFVKAQDEESFYIRIDAETRQLTDRALVDYCRKRFP